MAQAVTLDRNPALDAALDDQAAQATKDFDKSIADVETEAKTHSERGKELAGTIAKARDELGALKPPSTPDVPEPPQPKYRDPMEGFGSNATIFATFASLLTRRPLVNALNASASVMTAQRGQDRQAYEDAIQTWKLNFDKAKELHNWQKDLYDEIVKKIDTDVKGAQAEFEAYGSALGDKQIVMLAQQHKFDDLVKLLEFRENKMIQMQNHADIIEQRQEDRRAREDIARQGREERWQLYKDEKTGRTVEVNPVTNQVREIGGKILSPEEVKDLTLGKISSQGQGVPSTPEEREAVAAQVATGQPMNQIIPGYGTAAVAARTQARNDAIKRIMDENQDMSPAAAGRELARRSVEFQAGKTSVTQLNTMLGATRQAVNQLDFNVRKVKEEMNKLGSSDISPVINAIARGAEKWTGDPAYSGLFFYMHAVATESARILAGGQASRAQLQVGAMAEAKEWANVNMTPASFDEVAKAMVDEGNNRIKNFEDAKTAQAVSVGGKPPSATGIIKYDAHGNRVP